MVWQRHQDQLRHHFVIDSEAKCATAPLDAQWCNQTILDAGPSVSSWLTCPSVHMYTNCVQSTHACVACQF